MPTATGAPAGAPGQRRELHPAQVLVLGFAAAIALGTVLLASPPAAEPGRQVSLLDAFFTATSAVTVTGLTVVPTAASYSTFGEVVILVLIQIGGLGIMTISVLVALLLGKRVGLRERLVMQEALNQGTLAGIVRLTRWIAGVTFAVEAAGALILGLRWAAERPLSEALYLGLFHSVAAFNNAGFDLFGNSLMGFVADPVVNLTVLALLVTGGLGFVVVAELRQRLAGTAEPRRLSLHTRLVLVTNLILAVAGFVAVLVLEWRNPETLGRLPLAARPLAALFHALTPRTAGFNTLDVAALTPATLVVTMILMFIGASPVSTGGGIKTTTLAVVWLAVRATFRGRSDVEIWQRRLPRDSVDRALVLALVAATLVVAGVGVLTMTERAEFLALLFEVVSAFGTVGLSTGVTPELTPVGKLIVAGIMFAGRVGPLTLGYALARRQLAAAVAVRYPEERVIIG